MLFIDIYIVICICLIVKDITTTAIHVIIMLPLVYVFARLQVATGSASGGRSSGSGVYSAVGGSDIPSWITTE